MVTLGDLVVIVAIRSAAGLAGAVRLVGVFAG
jgi:hypothetical protein